MEQDSQQFIDQQIEQVLKKYSQAYPTNNQDTINLQQIVQGEGGDNEQEKTIFEQQLQHKKIVIIKQDEYQIPSFQNQAIDLDHEPSVGGSLESVSFFEIQFYQGNRDYTNKNFFPQFKKMIIKENLKLFDQDSQLDENTFDYYCQPAYHLSLSTHLKQKLFERLWQLKKASTITKLGSKKHLRQIKKLIVQKYDPQINRP